MILRLVPYFYYKIIVSANEKKTRQTSRRQEWTAESHSPGDWIHTTQVITQSRLGKTRLALVQTIVKPSPENEEAKCP